MRIIWEKKEELLKENVSLVTHFRDQQLLVNMVTNLDTNLKKKLLVTKIITIINKKL